MKQNLGMAMLIGASSMLAPNAHAQWPSDLSQNLAIANVQGAQQVQAKLHALPDSSWYVSWFSSHKVGSTPAGFQVYLQKLDANGQEQLPHNGTRIAPLNLSWTEDYGLAVDARGNALLTFQDDRQSPQNPQISATKISATGDHLWGSAGVALTAAASSQHQPRIAATSDGHAVVGWSDDEGGIVVQRLDDQGHTLWSESPRSRPGIHLGETGANYMLADLRATEDGAVIVSIVRQDPRTRENQLLASKIAADGSFLWGATPLAISQNGSLQMGNFPSFLSDERGGAVFTWYIAYPKLQVFAQHILANGTAAFPEGGVEVSTHSQRARVEPSASYDAASGETFVFWSELSDPDTQSHRGVYGQKFDAEGRRQWGEEGLVVEALSRNVPNFIQTVATQDGVMSFWLYSKHGAQGEDVVQGVKLAADGASLCPKFTLTAPSHKSRLTAARAPSGLVALAWEEQRSDLADTTAIYMQNVNPDCSVGMGAH